MIDYSNPILLSIRRVGQKLGVLRPLVRFFRNVFNLSYESAFDRKMMELVKPDFVVWDVGANTGYFTKKFSEKVGAGGLVYAFEPSPTTYKSLVKNCKQLKNVDCKNIALSNVSGVYSFRESDIADDPTNGLVVDGSPDAIVVDVDTCDGLVERRTLSAPNLVKVDVEGYGLDVVQGMQEQLKNRVLEMLFIEVHFLELSKRGLKDGAFELVNLIRDSGFSVTWTDPSHLIAIRDS